MFACPPARALECMDSVDARVWVCSCVKMCVRECMHAYVFECLANVYIFGRVCVCVDACLRYVFLLRRHDPHSDS